MFCKARLVGDNGLTFILFPETRAPDAISDRRLARELAAARVERDLKRRTPAGREALPGSHRRLASRDSGPGIGGKDRLLGEAILKAPRPL
jgi:hypothetical protein